MLVSLIMLLVLSTGSLFYYAYLNVAELSIKSEATFRLQHGAAGQSETIKVPLGAFQKDKDEIWFNNHLYDIVSWHIVQDTAFVRVLRMCK